MVAHLNILGRGFQNSSFFFFATVSEGVMSVDLLCYVYVTKDIIRDL